MKYDDHQTARAPTEPGKIIFREVGFTEWSCVCTLPPNQEEAPAWKRQSGPGAERDSCSCLGIGLTGTGSGFCWAETVQRGSRDIPGLVWEWQAGTRPH